MNIVIYALLAYGGMAAVSLLIIALLVLINRVITRAGREEERHE